jgi:hypothetical protein
MSEEARTKFSAWEASQQLIASGLRTCTFCSKNKPLTDYMTKAGKAYYQICKPCRPHNQRAYLAANPEIEAQRRSKDIQNRKIVVDYIQPLKEKGCADCKRYFPDAMDFDHTCHPSEKTYNIAEIHSHKGASTNLLTMLKEELSKGEFVCVNCHRIRTINRQPSNRRMQYLVDPTTTSLPDTIKYVYATLAKSDCSDCSEENFLTLEFDHVRGKKKHDLSFMMGKAKSFVLSDFQKEINKCEIRCANCHRMRTLARLRGLETTSQEMKDVTTTKCACGGRKTAVSAKCLTCQHTREAEKADNRYGNLEKLLIQLRNSSFVAVAKAYNVSDTAVRKYLVNRGIDPKTLSVIQSK